MTELEAASQRVCLAIQSEDMDQVASALQDRSRLLGAGAEPTELAFVLGQEGAQLLGSLKQKLALESARREQLLAGTKDQRKPHFDWCG